MKGFKDMKSEETVPTKVTENATPKVRGIILTEDVEGHGGKGESRVGYIRRRIFDEKATRTGVAKELNVPYQIVYAAIKGVLKETNDFSAGKRTKDVEAIPDPS